MSEPETPETPEETPATPEGAPDEVASSPDASEAPAEKAAPSAHDKRIFGIKLHNLIFVGMILGLVLGLGAYSLPHHDVVTLKTAQADGRTELRGHALHVPKEKLYVVMSPEGLETRVEEDQVDQVVMASKTSSGSLYLNALWWFNLFGKTLFLSALKMIIAPLILCSIVAGIVSLTGLDQLKRIGFKTMAYYVCSTFIAVAIGLAVVLTLQPGKKEAGVRLRAQRQAKLTLREQEYKTQKGKSARDDKSKATGDYLEWLAEIEAKEAGTGHEAGRATKLSSAKGRGAGDILVDGLIKPMLTNPFYSLSEGKSLGIIFFALLLGVAIVIVGPTARPLGDVFVSGNEVIIWITTWLMNFAPFCVMCLVAALVAEKGPAVFQVLAWYCVAVIGGILVHVGVLIAIANFLGGCTPARLIMGLREALMIAFTTRSSAATLPVTMRCVIEKLGVSPRVANFSLPVGATMNMDGTALYEGVAVIFLIQIFGGLVDAPFELTLAVTLVIFVTAVMASIGAAAVPDAGLVTMVLVAEAVGLPVYYIPLIFAVDAFLDMFRTTTNVLGDAVGSLVVDRLEAGSGAELATPVPT